MRDRIVHDPRELESAWPRAPSLVAVTVPLGMVALAVMLVIQLPKIRGMVAAYEVELTTLQSWALGWAGPALLLVGAVLTALALRRARDDRGRWTTIVLALLATGSVCAAAMSAFGEVVTMLSGRF